MLGKEGFTTEKKERKSEGRELIQSNMKRKCHKKMRRKTTEFMHGVLPKDMVMPPISFRCTWLIGPGRDTVAI